MFEGPFGKRLWPLIIELCEAAYPESVSLEDITNEFRIRDPTNPDWTEPMRHEGEDMTDMKYPHEIRHALSTQLVAQEGILANPKRKHYRFLTDEDRSRSVLDLTDVWAEVREKAYIEGKNNNSCRSADGSSFFKFVVIDDVPHIYDARGAEKEISKKVVSHIVNAINRNNGRVQQGWRFMAQRSAVVHCCEMLKFDSEGWISIVEQNVSIFREGDVIDSFQEEPEAADIRSLARQAKSRSEGGTTTTTRNRNKIPFELDEEWIVDKERLTCCEITGIEFSDTSGPFARSLDQRIPGKGYTRDNVDVVVRMYNFAKNKFSSEDVVFFCRKFAENIGMR